MASKQVTDRQKGAEAVAAVAEAQGATLATAVSRVLGDSGTEAATSLVGALRQALLASRQQMVDADAQHERELSDDPGARAKRDEVAEALSAKLVDLREIVTGFYSSQVAQELLSGPTPQDPVVLERFAGEVADKLANIQLPAPRIAGAKLDKNELSAELSTSRAELRAKLEAVAHEVREAQDTLAKKNRAIEEYDRVFSGIATVFTGLFTLAGEVELAEKVRPSLRRPGRTRDQDDDNAGEGPGEGAEEGAEEAAPPTPVA